MVGTLKERLKACAVGPYRKLAGSLSMKPIKTSKSFVDDKKVSDHHAIIPTEQFVQLDHMTNEERKIYDLVVRRFLSVLMPPFEYEQTTIKAQAAGEIFLAKGKIDVYKRQVLCGLHSQKKKHDERENSIDGRASCD